MTKATKATPRKPDTSTAQPAPEAPEAHMPEAAEAGAGPAAGDAPEPETIESSEDAAAEAAAEGSPGEALVAELEALRAEREQARDHMLRALAEAENTRRRVERDKEESVKFAVARFARDLLEVADSLALALQSVSDETREDPAISNLITGVSATEQALLSTLEKHGVTRVSAAGEKFDPNLHEAMFEIPTEEVPAGHVAQVIQPGYVLNGRLLRPARVGVARKAG